MKLSQKQKIILVGGVVLVIVIIFVVIMNLRPAATGGAAAAKLTVWGTESAQQFAPIAASYPYATVTYTQIDPANYDATVLSALAAGTGPDVFEIGDHSLARWQAVLAPMPAALEAQFGPLQVQNTFPDVVSQDFIIGSSSIYALPLSIDTLAMIYNKDLFNSAGIAIPPKTWDDFEADVVKLRSSNAQGNLTEAGAAIGGSATTISNAPDILSLLMLQNGTAMTSNNDTSATFASGSGGAGLAAFNFYLQFANASSPYYAWNDSLGDAVDAFAQGKTAIFFGYESDLAAIEAKAPFLNVGVAAMPQPSGATIAINYANYEGFAAAKAGQTALAWNFIVTLTATDANEKMYVLVTGKPPATRAEIQVNLNNSALSVFASQALTAKSWYEPDDEKVGTIFGTAIQNVLTGTTDPATALNQAQAAVTALIQ